MNASCFYCEGQQRQKFFISSIFVWQIKMVFPFCQTIYSRWESCSCFWLTLDDADLDEYQQGATKLTSILTKRSRKWCYQTVKTTGFSVSTTNSLPGYLHHLHQVQQSIAKSVKNVGWYMCSSTSLAGRNWFVIFSKVFLIRG